jgi:pimeloyl-ACP methyl ester carboxylesterase
MATVVSQDGTRIAYERTGEGPPVVLVPAALSTRAFDPLTGELAKLLTDPFTVCWYDRRGRGESGDTAPYAVDREIEDIAAIVDAAGGSACLYGLSSGAALALLAAERLPLVTKLAMYEPPFIVDDGRPPLPPDYVEQLDAAVAAGRRGEAVEIFMTKAVGVPTEYLAPMRQDPSWAGMEAVAHTLSYDGRVMGSTMSGRPLPAAWGRITTPTLVMVGGDSEPFMHAGGRALADLLPHAELRVLPGQGHAVDAAVLVPVLTDFFTG